MHAGSVPTADALLARLRHQGRQSSSTLLTALGISRPTLARAVAATPGVVRLGKARATQYALARAIRGEWQWPLYRLDADARVQPLGMLLALDRGEFAFVSEAHPASLPPASLLHPPFEQGIYPDVPWFLDDLRPNGFLGRTYAHRMADALRLPGDLARWDSGHVITALLHGGSAQTGDLILGDAALERALRERLDPPDRVTMAERAVRYPRMADDVLQGEPPGSSPGGEQAKFTATIEAGDRRHAAIVKFSIAGSSAAARRWASLLRCEALAGQVLSAHGLPAAQAALVEADGQVFLESRRFDRSDDVLGRRGFVSLSAIATAFFAEASLPWWQLARRLEADGWIDAGTATQLSRLHWFGALIANSDMHLGNAGLVLTDTLPLRAAPAYDMLPMWLRPGAQGHVAIRDYAVPIPPAGQVDAWRWAAHAACDFWRQVQRLDAVEADVRQFAQRIERDIREMTARF
ncbi:type II toxin-antitoxin system HipA family toxin YjjJ [Luteimonas sp. BDR2-5]|uniref:type II toxin-antitoxin system HipA family toxin YjjJ n=1 Tax=Proluteimonas luteida TaxID=2878685 RepID=UPI001E58AE3A|nr:type II toxin-antitoxin system HipA family toxin YjjJ [Luteimonas sp. BDR2-5]MCD9029131.1 type II toxin-antitoxin system HipA family toxin YjjJ [Luteimonas sp. BDR2-5]